jgi:hypothetical protein
MAKTKRTPDTPLADGRFYESAVEPLQGEPDPQNPRWHEGQPQQPQEQGEQPPLDGSKPRESHERMGYQTERLIVHIADDTSR